MGKLAQNNSRRIQKVISLLKPAWERAKEVFEGGVWSRQNVASKLIGPGPLALVDLQTENSGGALKNNMVIEICL